MVPVCGASRMVGCPLYGTTRTLDLRELLRSTSANLRRVMQCDFVGVALPDAESSAHLRLYAMDFPESKRFIREESPVSMERTPPGIVFKAGEPYVA